MSTTIKDGIAITHLNPNTGDKVTFEGEHYISTIDGNVWSPAAYPAGWAKQ